MYYFFGKLDNVSSYILKVNNYHQETRAETLLGDIPLLMSQNSVTRLEEPAATSLQIITFSEKHIICMCKVVNCITVKVFYLAKSCFSKKNYNSQQPCHRHFKFPST